MPSFDRQTRQALIDGGLADRLVARWIDPSQGLVINGFWRSGTTFLLEQAAQRLRAKPLFEPLDADVPGYAAVLNEMRPPGQMAQDFDRYFMPHALTPALAAHLERAFAYRILHPAVQRARTNLSAHGRKPRGMPDWLAQQNLGRRRRVVVKCVRASLLLPALIARYGGAVLHIRRRGEAVLASFRSADWSAFQPSRLKLGRLLLDVEDGRRAYFAAFADLIAALDEAPADDRLIGYWALTERFVADHVAPERVIDYEALTLGEIDLDACLRGQGLCPRAPATPGFNSATTTAARAGLSAQARVDGWQDQLRPAEIARVAEIATAVERIETPGTTR